MSALIICQLRHVLSKCNVLLKNFKLSPNFSSEFADVLYCNCLTDFISRYYHRFDLKHSSETASVLTKDSGMMGAKITIKMRHYKLNHNRGNATLILILDSGIVIHRNSGLKYEFNYLPLKTFSRPIAMTCD